MMYQFMDAWTNVCYSNGLQKGLVNKTSFILVSPDFKGDLPQIPNSIVVHCTTNQSWVIVRTQVEGFHDLDNVHAIQDQYDLRPLSAYGKPFTQPLGTVDPNIPLTPGPSIQANNYDGRSFLPRPRNGLTRCRSLMKIRQRAWTKSLRSSALFMGSPLTTRVFLSKRRRQWASR